MAFKDRLKELRAKRHITQDEFSQQSGIGRSSVSMYEAGQRMPSNKVLCQIASFFNVSTDYLLGSSPNITVCHSDDYTMPADAAPINKLIENLFADNPKALAILNGQKTPTMASGALANKKLEDMTDSEKEYIKNALLLGLKAGGFDV